MKALFLLLITLTIAGCSVYTDIYTDYDRSVDFTKYKTFAWLPDRDSANTPYNNQIVRNNTLNYFTHCMGERGMKAEVDSPDVLLEIAVTSAKKESTVTVPVYNYNPRYYNYNPYYYPSPNSYYYRYPYTYNYTYTYTYETRKVEYTESTITLNVIDRKQNKLVWTGRAKGDLYDPYYFQYNLHPAVYDILSEYPVAASSEHKRPR